MSNKDIIRKTKYTYKKKPIGAGSFAKVYLAKNSEGNYRALKSIDLSILSDEKKLRVVRELEISKEMNHPNVVQCFEVIKTDNHKTIQKSG
jgi:serine/threonine protein kinase